MTADETVWALREALYVMLYLEFPVSSDRKDFI